MTEKSARHAQNKESMHKIIMELEFWIGEIYLAAIALNQIGSDDGAELYRTMAKVLQGRVNTLVYDYGRPSIDTFRLEMRDGLRSESFPPVDLFEILRDSSSDTTQFVSAVGSASE